MARRTFLSTGAALLSVAGQSRAASPAGGHASTFASDWGTSARPRRGSPAPLPPGYIVMGERYGVPPMVLYGVALQESAKLFGQLSLPWPWTLNVQGSPKRYASFAAAVTALQGFIASGIRNVDTGLMQVNWGYHRDKLVEPARALDPYPNISVGAQILRDQFTQTRDWYSAVGRYHSPGNAQRAAAYSALVYRRIAQVPQASRLPSSGGLHG